MCSMLGVIKTKWNCESMVQTTSGILAMRLRSRSSLEAADGGAGGPAGFRQPICFAPPQGCGFRFEDTTIETGRAPLHDRQMRAEALERTGRDGGLARDQLTTPRRTALKTNSAVLCKSSFSIMRQRWVSMV